MGLLPDQQLDFFQAVDSIPALSGAGVGYDEANGVCRELRPSNHSSGLDTYVVIDEVASGSKEQPPTPPTQFTWDRFGREFLGVGLNCTGFALSTASLASEIAATPVTLGGSLLALAPTAVGAVASGGQCVMSISRVVNAFQDPDRNKQLDADEGYQALSTVLDYASLGTAAYGTLSKLPELATMYSEAKLMGQSRQVVRAAVRGMTDAERELLAEDIVKVVDAPTSEARAALVAQIRDGKFPNTYRKVAAQGFQQQLWSSMRRTALEAGLPIVGSALPAGVSSSAGILNEILSRSKTLTPFGRSVPPALDYVIHVIQE